MQPDNIDDVIKYHRVKTIVKKQTLGNAAVKPTFLSYPYLNEYLQ